jgi:hypothetical protein
MPRPVRVARVLLFVGAGLTGLMVSAALLALGISAPLLGSLLWFAWPGVAALVIGLKLPGGGKRLYWATVVVSAFWILSALAALGGGDPRGLTQLILPVAVLVLITRRSAKDFFLAR